MCGVHKCWWKALIAEVTLNRAQYLGVEWRALNSPNGTQVFAEFDRLSPDRPPQLDAGPYRWDTDTVGTAAPRIP